MPIGEDPSAVTTDDRHREEIPFFFPVDIDPQRLDVIGSLECIQVWDLPVPTFGDSGDRCILFPVSLGELNAPFLTLHGRDLPCPH